MNKKTVRVVAIISLLAMIGASVASIIAYFM